ncbi:MAG: Rrf2 family transcriptional regulator [Planctomycetota bacterium]
MAKILSISRAATLAMHAMVLVAAQPKGATIKTEEISKFLKVSKAHLSKVIQRLGSVGLIDSIRGPSGGIYIKKPAGKITLLEVYEAVEGQLSSIDCLLGTWICGGKFCILGDVVKSINKLVKEYFSKTKISELADIYRRNI